jgi:hypothetical protein
MLEKAQAGKQGDSQEIRQGTARKGGVLFSRRANPDLSYFPKKKARGVAGELSEGAVGLAGKNVEVMTDASAVSFTSVRSEWFDLDVEATEQIRDLILADESHFGQFGTHAVFVPKKTDRNDPGLTNADFHTIRDHCHICAIGQDAVRMDQVVTTDSHVVVGQIGLNEQETFADLISELLAISDGVGRSIDRADVSEACPNEVTRVIARA